MGDTTLLLETTDRREETAVLGGEALLAAFEACSLPAGTFHHREHVEVAWLYLRRYPVTTALERFAAGLKRFATANGAAEKYHETITWAYVLLVHERIERLGDVDWPEFAAQNEDLLDYAKPVLKRYYRSETLASPLARTVFVLPDRALVTGVGADL